MPRTPPWWPPVPTALAADVVATSRGRVLLIRRGSPPYRGRWAFPGGFVEPGERLADAARRELREETGVVAGRLRPLGAYGEPRRDPRGRTVSFVFLARLPRPGLAAGADDAAEARWVPIARARRLPMAFDHAAILSDALRRARRA